MNQQYYTVFRGVSFLTLAIAIMLMSLSLLAQESDPPCDVSLNDEMSLTSAIESAAPGALICLESGTWSESILIDKSLTLRGSGSSSSIILGLRTEPNVISVDSDSEIEVALVGLSIQGSALDGAGISVRGVAIVTAASLQVENNGTGISVQDEAVLLLNASAIVNNVATSEMTDDDEAIYAGLLASGSALVEIENSQFENDGEFGVLALESASLKLVDSVLSANLIGVAVVDSADALIDDSRIHRNEEQGVGFLGHSTGMIRNSLIEENGAATKCQLMGDEPGGEICNGVFFIGTPKVTILDSAIESNTDWGIAASIRECGYNENQFFGSVRFEGSNIIAGNNLSGNHDGNGNPGSHSFQTASEGQVCLN